jgi:hypothetical protein
LIPHATLPWCLCCSGMSCCQCMLSAILIAIKRMIHWKKGILTFFLCYVHVFLYCVSWKIWPFIYIKQEHK